MRTMPTGSMYRKSVGPVGGGQIKENVVYPVSLGIISLKMNKQL